MKKNNFVSMFSIGLGFLSILYLLSPLSAPNSKEHKQAYVSISSDYPTYSTLEGMTDAADFIVVGSYTEFLTTWNMDRLPEDPSQEDPNSYSEGRKYNFRVDEVIKGENVPENITINKGYSVQGEYDSIPFQMPSQYFVEPKIGETYMLFLSYDSVGNLFYLMGEPGEIENVDGNAQLASNLFSVHPQSLPPLSSTAETETTIYEISIETNTTQMYDFVSGKQWSEILNSVSNLVAS